MENFPSLLQGHKIISMIILLRKEEGSTFSMVFSMMPFVSSGLISLLVWGLAPSSSVPHCILLLWLIPYGAFEGVRTLIYFGYPLEPVVGACCRHLEILFYFSNDELGWFLPRYSFLFVEITIFKSKNEKICQGQTLWPWHSHIKLFVTCLNKWLYYKWFYLLLMCIPTNIVKWYW